MEDKYHQVKNLIDYLSNTELLKLLEYCKRRFPKAYRRVHAPNDAIRVKEIDRILGNLTAGKPFDLRKTMDIIERDIIHLSLRRLRSQAKTAQLLRMKEQTLRYKMLRLKIPTIRAHPEYYLERRTV